MYNKDQSKETFRLDQDAMAPTFEMLDVRCFTCGRVFHGGLEKFERMKREAGYYQLTETLEGDALELAQKDITNKIFKELRLRLCCVKHYISPTVYAIRMDTANIKQITPHYVSAYHSTIEPQTSKKIKAPRKLMIENLQPSALTQVVSEPLKSDRQPWKYSLADTDLIKLNHGYTYDIPKLLKDVPPEMKDPVEVELRKIIEDQPILPLTAFDRYEYQQVNGKTIRKYIVN